MAGDVLRVHHQELQRGITDRVRAAVFDIYHPWYVFFSRKGMEFTALTRYRPFSRVRDSFGIAYVLASNVSHTG